MKWLILAILGLGHGSFAQTCPPNGCVSFSVGPGTGCDWMCTYCANSLGTSNYYFTTPVCAYQTGGCAGNPVAGVQYTCCASSTHS